MSSIRAFLTELHAWERLGIFLARLPIGLLFFLSGRGKLFVPERREQMRQTLIEGHILFPEFNAWLCIYVKDFRRRKYFVLATRQINP